MQGIQGRSSYRAVMIVAAAVAAICVMPHGIWTGSRDLGEDVVAPAADSEEPPAPPEKPKPAPQEVSARPSVSPQPVATSGYIRSSRLTMPDPFALSGRLPLQPDRFARRAGHRSAGLLPALAVGFGGACLVMLKLRRRKTVVSTSHKRMARTLSGAFKKGVLRGPSHERLFRRQTCSSNVKVWWKDIYGNSVVEGFCLDMSEGGAGLVFSVSLPSGIQVSMQLENQPVEHAALVKHCQQRGEWFFVGLQFVDGFGKPKSKTALPMRVCA